MGLSLETKQCLKRLERVRLHAKRNAKMGSRTVELTVKAEHKNVLDAKQVAKLAKHVNLHVKEIISAALV